MVTIAGGVCALMALLLTGCVHDDGGDSKMPPPPFELLSEDFTGLRFSNAPVLTPDLNVFNYMYFYNGGGLGCGDFNGDGLPDLFFTTNLEGKALFLNEGDMHFRDVTDAANLDGKDGWNTGVAVVDINQDGRLDIYVSRVSGFLGLTGHNDLYINQGNDPKGVPTFREAAAEYGLDQQGFGTQAVFFDYDGDGDLDCFQLNHSVHQNGTFGPRQDAGRAARHPLAGDRLLRNDGPPSAVGEGGFTDVSAEAGIIGTALGYGLGVAVGDINNDGWPDLYIGNDFHENDYLYLNERDGTFREALGDAVGHTSRFTMGVEMADLDNDGNDEIFALDMLPEDPVILKQSLAEDGFDVFRFKMRFGYAPQFSRNTLQYNLGDGTFSEIAAQAGVHASDWSWGPLVFDMNDDGYRDIFISNGIPRRMNDIDWINFKTQDNSNRTGSTEAATNEDELESINKMPQIKLRNKFYLNTGELQFADLSDDVAGAETSYSSGAVVADLDGDGDLDVVTNNLEDAPFVYRNLLRGASDRSVPAGAYLSVNLIGEVPNRNAIGASVIVLSGDERQRNMLFTSRGFQSSTLAPLHIGIADTLRVDSLLVVWPDRTYQSLRPDRYNDTLDVYWRPGLPNYDFTHLGRRSPPAPYQVVADGAGIDYRHRENEFVDFNREPLIPHMLSTEGPALAVGDVTGDGLEDFFVGSSKFERSALYVQNANGRFERAETPTIAQDSVFEDVDAALVDLEGDGDLDLLVAAGGNEYAERQAPRKQRSYINDGRGNFVRQDVLPDIFLTASRVLPADVNGDGLVDIVITGRSVPFNYGEIPRSYLFLNRGDLVFEDVTEASAPDLAEVGMVSDAIWTDLDQDGDPDLIVAVEWGQVTAFINENGRFSARAITRLSGWWTTLAAADVDQDGDVDILAGNFGKNSKFQPTEDNPIRLNINDYDGNGRNEPVLTYFIKGREIPFANYAEMTKQLPGLKKKYIYARDFARASLPEIFGAAAWKDARRLEIQTMESVLIRQSAMLEFQTIPLPQEVQRSSIHAIQPLPPTDQESGFLIGGNFLGANIEMGWYDAGRPMVLTFNRSGEPSVSRLPELPYGQIRDINAIRDPNDGVSYLIAYNNDSLQLIRPTDRE